MNFRRKKNIDLDSDAEIEIIIEKDTSAPVVISEDLIPFFDDEIDGEIINLPVNVLVEDDGGLILNSDHEEVDFQLSCSSTSKPNKFKCDLCGKGI